MAYDAMNRRRFLVLVGGAAGTLLSAGCGQHEAGPAGGLPGAGASSLAGGIDGGLPGGSSGLLSVDADDVGEAGVEVVAVEPELVDMTAWHGEFLTLRPGPAGMLVRSESTGRDYPVEVPDGFAARCIGTHGDLLAVCGHRVVYTGYMIFEAGTPYETLLEQAGPHAALLTAQPSRPEVRPYRHEFIERFPALLTTDNLLDWEHFDLALGIGTGGSFGAVIERGGVLAADHYAYAEVSDSVFEASLISLADAVAGKVSASGAPIPLDHGALWGTSDTGTSGLVVVNDRTGTYAYDDKQRPVIAVTDNAAVLGVEPRGGFLNVAVQTSDGLREIRQFRNGTQQAVEGIGTGDPVRHRISPDITVTSPDGVHSVIPNTNIANSHAVRQ